MKKILCIIFGLFLYSTLAFSTIYIKRSADEILELSHMVVVADVIEIKMGKASTVLGSDGESLYTFVRLSIVDDLKGNIKTDEITLKEHGGFYNGLGLDVFNAPKYQVGERVFIILQTRSDGSAYTCYKELGRIPLDDNQPFLKKSTDFSPMHDAIKQWGISGIKDRLSSAKKMAVYQPPLKWENITANVLWNTQLKYNFFATPWKYVGAVSTKVDTDDVPFSLNGATAVDNSAAAWVGGEGDLDLTTGTTFNTTTNPEDSGTIPAANTIEIFFDDPYAEVGKKATVLAHGGSWYSGSTTDQCGTTCRIAISGYVVFNNNVDYEGTSCDTQSDLEEVMTHELGHVLGLAHEDVIAGAIMNSFASCADRGAILGTDDSNGITALYGSCVNVDPVINSFVVPATGNQNSVINFSASATDGNSDSLTYTWDWGDSTSDSTGTNPSHTYTTVNTFTVTLTVTDGNGGSDSDTDTITISAPPPNSDPVINSFVVPATGFQNVSTNFSASATDVDLNPLTYTWDWGDSSSDSTGTNPSHTYTTVNTFTVTLTVTDGVGGSDSDTDTITISVPPPNTAPVINSFVVPATGTQNSSNNFSASASDDDGDSMTYSWDWGDSTADGSGTSPSHTYGGTGTFTVTLTVTDGKGGSDTDTDTILISAGGGNSVPVINSFSIPSTGDLNTMVAFTASATDGDGDSLSYSWEWGDGTADGAGSSTSHVFTSSSTYSVRLTVTDGHGGSATEIGSIAISSSGNNAPKITSFTIPSTGTQNDSLNFLVNATDTDGDPLTYNWDWGDGTIAGSGDSTSHTFTIVSTYLITVTVTDDLGGSDSKSRYIEIGHSETSLPIFVDQTAATSNGNSSVFLSWQGGVTAGQQLSHYNVYEQRNTKALFLLGTTTNTMYMANGLTGNTTYTFSVQPQFISGKTGSNTDIVITTPNEDLYQIRFNHVAQNSQWFTGIVLVNPNVSTADITFILVKNDGSEVVSNNLTQLDPGEKVVGLVNGYFDQSDLDSASWMVAQSSQSLVGFELFGLNSFANMSGIQVGTEGFNQGVFAVGQADNEQYVAMSWVNPSLTQSATIQLFGLAEDGTVLATESTIVDPKGKLVDVVQNLMGANWSSDIVAIRWESDSPVHGFELWGDISPRNRMSGMPSLPSGGKTLVLPWLEENAVAQIVNPNDVANSITYTLYTKKGSILGSKTYQMDSNEHINITSASFGSVSLEGSLIITAQYPVTGVVDLYRDRGNGEVMSEAIPGQVLAGDKLVFSHIASSSQWSTELFLVNLESSTNAINLSSYTKEGVFLETIKVNLRGNGMIQDKVLNLGFSQLSSIGYIIAESTSGNMVGHLIYYTNTGFGHVMGGTSVTPLQ